MTIFSCGGSGRARRRSSSTGSSRLSLWRGWTGSVDIWLAIVRTVDGRRGQHPTGMGARTGRHTEGVTSGRGWRGRRGPGAAACHRPGWAPVSAASTTPVPTATASQPSVSAVSGSGRHRRLGQRSPRPWRWPCCHRPGPLRPRCPRPGPWRCSGRPVSPGRRTRRRWRLRCSRRPARVRVAVVAVDHRVVAVTVDRLGLAVGTVGERHRPLPFRFAGRRARLERTVGGHADVRAGVGRRRSQPRSQRASGECHRCARRISLVPAPPDSCAPPDRPKNSLTSFRLFAVWHAQSPGVKGGHEHEEHAAIYTPAAQHV